MRTTAASVKAIVRSVDNGLRVVTRCCSCVAMRGSVVALQSSLHHPLNLFREWQSVVTQPDCNTNEILSVSRLLCSLHAPREAKQLLAQHGDRSPESRDTHDLVTKQRDYVKGKYDPFQLYFNRTPGVLPDFVSADVCVKVRFEIHAAGLHGPARARSRLHISLDSERVLHAE